MRSHPERPYDWVGAWSEKRAQLSPEKVGLVDETTGERYTYAELDRRANRTARLLRAEGVTGDGEGDGERVAVLSRNRPELVDLFFATAKTGGVLAPLSHRLAAGELVEMLNEVEPALLVVEEPFADLAARILDHEACGFDCSVLALSADDADDSASASSESASDSSAIAAEPWTDALPDDDSPVETADASMDDPHLFLHTGGSTGVPKETVLTHGSILWNSFNTITAWGLRPEDVTPMVFPMFHTGGWNVLTVPMFHLGATVVLAREFEPSEVLHLVESEGATVLVAVPAVLRMMTHHDDWADTDLSTLRFAKSGGGPCRESVMEAWWDRGVDLSQGYGLTECGPNNFTMPDGWPREKADSVGVPVMHADARIADGEGEELPAGEIGELELASPHAADRYWRNDEETAETFGDGWVSTGDLARRDDDGYFYIEGRKKNMYVSGGENVYPAAVEDRIADHPKVEEVVVVPVPDDRWGQVGMAVVQGDESLTLDELTDFLDGKLARFKRPRHLAFVDEMPTSGPSKIDRQAVKAEFGEE
ncbi:AMP-binding protein [Halorussus gelatinilyticus]|uniref:AMP-binding protein n=1 Tax=Halorussus gelatinilyticus TaxID=2937524 RepID=A0A8U0IDW9_9EURY|nr:AMP-binding protein [Halorussus gelatinilyticus]UPV99132.1 AMP-binding protein [Halorussus gelatinilyticus]